MKVEWSEEAGGQIQAIREYLARTSPGYAQALTEKIVKRTERLAEQPFLGAEVSEYVDERIREVFEHPYRIIYLVEGELVRVIGVLHAARRMPRLPPTG